MLLPHLGCCNNLQPTSRIAGSIGRLEIRQALHTERTAGLRKQTMSIQERCYLELNDLLQTKTLEVRP